MTPETKHTPLPLPLERRGTMVYGPDHGPGTAPLVAECQSTEQADEIVRACNAHYALVEACEAALIDCEHLDAADLKPAQQSTLTELRRNLQAALAKALGSSSGGK